MLFIGFCYAIFWQQRILFSILMEEAKIFIDTKGHRWRYVKPKSGGARPGAEYTGVYEQIDEDGNPLIDAEGNPLNKFALIKSDALKYNDIAEYLSGVVYSILIPHNAPPGINLAVPEGENAPPYHTYVVSEFIEKATTLLETIGGQERVAVNLYGPLGIIDREFTTKRYEGLSSIIVASLVVADTDRHAGNLMVVAFHEGVAVKKNNRGKWIKGEIEVEEKDLTYKIYNIDFGSAYESHTIYSDRIRLNYGVKNFLLQRLKGKINNRNHMRYFPMGEKFSLETVRAIENTIAEKDAIKTGYDQAIENIKKYFSEEEIRSFITEKLGQTIDENLTKEELCAILDRELERSLDIRTEALRDLAAQIEVGLCIGAQNRVLDWDNSKYTDDKDGREVYIQDIICKYLDFFVKLLSKEEEFKLLRFPTHKKASISLKKSTSLYAAAVLSNILVERGEFESIDIAYEFIINENNKAQVEEKLQNINAIDPNTLWATPSLLGLALKGELNIDNRDQIINLIASGSNPNMELPNGRRIIDYAQDFEIKRVLIENGAKVTRKSLENLSLEEQQTLVILSILNDKLDTENKKKYIVNVFTGPKYSERLRAAKSPTPDKLDKFSLALLNLAPILLGTTFIAVHEMVLDSFLKPVYNNLIINSMNEFILQAAENLLIDKHFEPLLNAIKSIVENNNGLPVLIGVVAVLGVVATLIATKVIIDNDPYKKLEVMVNEEIRKMDNQGIVV